MKYTASSIMGATVSFGKLDRLFVQSLAPETPKFIIVDELAKEHHPIINDILSNSQYGHVCRRFSEIDKTAETLASLVDVLARHEFPKHGCLVGIGGGVVCDLAGYLAMIYRRGIPVMLIPTTLVAQIDAAIGGKNGLNASDHKNIIGGFHYPFHTIIDVHLLKSLPVIEVICGLAEMIKTFVVSDASALQELLIELHRGFQRSETLFEKLVPAAIKNKVALLQEDPLELKSTRLLNFGHALAHDLEEYSRFTLRHGLAVLIGMAMEVELSKQLALGPTDYLETLQKNIIRLFRESGALFPSGFVSLTRVVDKARSARRGSTNWVCPTTPGCAIILDDVEYPIIEKSWNSTRLLIN